jgi:hypothetical protein
VQVDPDVVSRKFANEVSILDKRARELLDWGCWRVRTEFPDIDVVFVPRAPLRLSVPAAPPQSFVVLPNQQLQMMTAEFQNLAARAIGVRIALDDFDQQPPSVTFRDPWSWGLLKFETMFRANNMDEHNRASAVLLDKHPKYDRPFLCMRGVREYHEHPQHTGDDWMLYRGNMGVFDILLTIYRTCVLMALPHVLVLPNAIQVVWEPTRSHLR